MCLLFAVTSLFANEITSSKNKFESGIVYCFHRPFYSVSHPLDIAFPKENKYRNNLGVVLRYYVFNNWFTEFGSSYSQQGGGIKPIYTKANYWKNGIHLGYSTDHHRRLMFETFVGIESNTLLSAKMINKVNGDKENVKDYYNYHFIGTQAGVGIKVRLNDQYFLGMLSSLGMSDYKVAKYINVSQVVFPMFQVKITKMFR